MFCDGPLAHRNFRLLLTSDGLSMLGSAMAAVAVPFAILDVGGSAADVGYVSAAVLASTVVCLLFGGVLSDRLPRLRVMVASEAVQCAAQAGFAAVVLTGRASMAMVVALSAVRGAAFGFYLPAAQGLVPQTVPADTLSAANAYRRLVANSTQIGGALAGGVAVAVLGAGWTLAADALSFAAALVVRVGMRMPAVHARRQSGYLQDLTEGWGEFTRHSWLWTTVIQFAIINATFVGCFTVLGPVVADETLNGARTWGAVVAAQAVGAAVGAGVIMRLRPHRPLIAGVLGAACLALPLIALATSTSLVLIAAAAVVAGIGVEIFAVAWATTTQEQIAQDTLSRVSAYDAVGSYALSPLGPLIVGPVSAVIGITGTLLAGGVLIAVAALALLAVPSVRALSSGTALTRA